MITPTPGRVVWFRQDRKATPVGGFAYHFDGQPLAAIVAYVHGDRMVNLTVFDALGVAWPRPSIPLRQDDDPVPEFGSYCEWMPYQKGQAARTSQLEKAYGGSVSDLAGGLG